MRERFESPLLVLISLATLVLLVACTNVASLLLARSSARRREIGVRLAVGAGRGRLIRQLLTESALLSLLGGAVGVAFTAWGGRFPLGFLPPEELTLALSAPSDARVLGFALGISILTGLLLGLAPAIRSTRADLAEALTGEESRARPGRRLKTSGVLVVLQIALSLLLVAGAGLFFRTLRNAAAVDLGLSTENVLMVTVTPSLAGYSPAQCSAFCRELEARLRAIPGVRSIGRGSGYLPLHRAFTQDGTKSSFRTGAIGTSVGGDFFAATGNRIVHGRAFTPEDALSAQKVVIVNEAWARLNLPGVEPVGQRYRPDRGLVERGYAAPEYEIVGVARDMRGVYERAVPTTYTNSDQTAPPTGGTYYVRTNGDPARYVPMLREIVKAIDKDVPISRVKKLDQERAESLARERSIAALSGFFGILALLLAVIGIYGVVAYAVARRTREIGIRMALGASREAVIWMALRGSLALAAAGIAIGLSLWLWISKLASSLLFGVQPNDPATLAATICMLAAAVTLAGWLPARRAARIDPMEALRHE